MHHLQCLMGITPRFYRLAPSLVVRLHLPFCVGMGTGTTTNAKLLRTKPRGRLPLKVLSAAFIRSALPRRHADGNGLYLYAQPNGARSWIQRLVIRGRRRELVLGSVALFSLPEAREKARVSDSLPAVKQALDFLVLTAAMWGEVRLAVWPVPATRIKAKRE